MNDLQIEVECNYCHKIVIKYKSQTKNHKKNYCSKECLAKSLSGEKYYIKCICDNCGDAFEKYKIYERGSKNNFCSCKCYGEYRHKEHNFGVGSRGLALSYYKHECEICHWDKLVDVLQVHHIDENRENNAVENLIILCPICHRIIHSGWGKLDNRKLIIFKEREKKRTNIKITKEQVKERLDDIKKEINNGSINDFGIYVKFAIKWNCTQCSARKYIERIKRYLFKNVSWDEIIKIKMNQNCFKST